MKIEIQNIKDPIDLIRYFSINLGWEISLEDFEVIEDITYDFDANDLGLKEEAFAKIKSLRQLPPLVDEQKWGIFCVEFDSNRFEITALRKILSGLIPKRRKSVDHVVWDQQDLLFLCFWGEGSERTIGLAYFSDQEIGLPQIKMIYCAPALEDFTQIQVFEKQLYNLTWPSNTSDVKEWQHQWSSAFKSVYRQSITDSTTLITQLVKTAQNIRNLILEILKVESAKGYVHSLYKRFKDALIHTMTEQEFADMYAQTIVYGLFSARCMDENQEDFSIDKAIKNIPSTNPFLKRLMSDCLKMNNSSNLTFDELEIGDVVELLCNIKTDAIIRDFNRQTGGGREDPVLHFYEKFLLFYDKSQKVQRGVYYTPQPVVNFIVRAVDDILKTEFKLKDGLASTKTKTIKIKRKSLRKINGFYRDIESTQKIPAVQILDPATGTGTFLRQVILQVYYNFIELNKELNNKELKEEWNQYVTNHLLPRINGFELMMAPYAVAHMKLAMVLKDTGYDFANNLRLNLYLTNSLEESGYSDKQITLWSDPLAIESIEANRIKQNNGINIIIGNPPYNVSSENKNEWINDLIADYKIDLTERKLNLDDDYIKFIRLAESIIERSDCGVVGFITNNSFIDGITHRQIRKHLLNTFSSIYIIDLHGNIMKNEKSLNGERDENIFDIRQGVSICLMIKNKNPRNPGLFHFEVKGSRRSKYDFLNNSTLQDIKWRAIVPDNEKCLFVPFDTTKQTEYLSGVSVAELFPMHNSGIQTKCDSISVGMSEKELSTNIKNFYTLSLSDLRAKYEKKDSKGWTFERAKEDLMNGDYIITPYYYRPFDVRYIIYTKRSGGFIGRPRDNIMRHIVNHKDNPCLCLMKQFFQDTIYNHVLYSNLPIDERTLYSNRGGTYVFPLYKFSVRNNQTQRTYNLNQQSVHRFESALGLKLSMKKEKGYFTGEELLAYIYAILFSSKFRKDFNTYLKYDFPIIPLPHDSNYFFEMVSLGQRLIDIHNPENFYRNWNMEEDIAVSILKDYKFDIKNKILKLNNEIFINIKDSTIYNYEIGGYKPIQKWLKSRKGAILYDVDISILKSIIKAIEQTIEVVEEIDQLYLDKM